MTSEKRKIMDYNAHMLAYCGIYCAQCSFKVASEENDIKHLKGIPPNLAKGKMDDLSVYDCECCKGVSICGPCRIRDCASAKGIDSCADCSGFPCEESDRFANDGFSHHFQAVENLKAIRGNGTEMWFRALKPALFCACGERQTWYYTCPGCGKLKQD